MKRKLSRLLAVVLFALALLASVPAYALTAGNSYSYTERHINAYYNTGGTFQTANGDYHSGSGQVALRNLTSTGEPIYCMQIYEGCTGADAKATNIDKTDLWNDEYSDKARDIVTHVSIWGYPNFTYGYSNDDAQLATQVLIWEAETGARTDYSYDASECKTWAKSIFNNYYDAFRCYKAILEACKNHTRIPNNNGRTFDLSGHTTEATAITITDGAGVLDQFKRVAGNGNIKTKIVDATHIKIWYDGKDNISNQTVAFTKEKTDINSVFALTGANQQLFYGTIADPVQFTLRFNAEVTKYCRVTVCKRDAADHSKILDGAFRLDPSLGATDNFCFYTKGVLNFI